MTVCMHVSIRPTVRAIKHTRLGPGIASGLLIFLLETSNQISLVACLGKLALSQELLQLRHFH